MSLSNYSLFTNGTQVTVNLEQYLYKLFFPFVYLILYDICNCKVIIISVFLAFLKLINSDIKCTLIKELIRYLQKLTWQ